MWRRVACGLLIVLLATAAVSAAGGAYRVTYRAALYTVRADGSGERLLVEPDPLVSAFVRSPSGRFILFNGPNDGDGTLALFAAERSGANPVRLTPPGLWAPLEGAAFSPDGRTIAFTTLEACGNWRCTRYTLYLVARDGTGLRGPLGDSAYWRTSPSWSPDGRRLAYVASGAVHVLDVETNRRTIVGPAGTRPVWAPRGNRIAYSTTRGGYGVACFVNADGSKRRCTHGHSLTSLVWSPDGRHVAFRDASSPRLGVMDSNARHVRSLGFHGSNAQPAAWSPDGRRLAFWFGSYGLFRNMSVLRLAAPTRPVVVVNKPDWPLTDVRWRASGITYVASTPIG